MHLTYSTLVSPFQTNFAQNSTTCRPDLDRQRLSLSLSPRYQTISTIMLPIVVVVSPPENPSRPRRHSDSQGEYPVVLTTTTTPPREHIGYKLRRPRGITSQTTPNSLQNSSQFVPPPTQARDPPKPLIFASEARVYASDDFIQSARSCPADCFIRYKAVWWRC